MKKLFWYIFFFVALITGCTTQYTVPVVDVKIDANKIPLRVGIVIPDENFTQTKSMPDFAGTTTTLTIPFGRLIKQSASDILPFVFESIEIVQGEPYPPGIKALFITTVEDFNKEPEHGGKPSVVHVKLSSRITDLEGIPLWSKTLSVREEEWPSTFGSWSYEATARFWGGIISKAVASALKETAREISLSREVHLFASAKGKTTASAAAADKDPSPIIKSDIDSLPSGKQKLNKKAYAIVVGIEQYRQKLPKADFAVSDAKLVGEYLTKVMGYPEENVVTLLNEHATNVDLAKYVEKWLWNNVEKDSSVFIYYSGHGAPNPKTGDAYLVPYDGDPSFIDQTGYSLKRLYEFLGKLPAKEIVVALDSCFSGAGGRSVIAKGARPLVMQMESLSIPQKIAVLSAASGDQISSTYDEKGHGLFTYFMLKGIKNEDVTRQDGSIKMDDLFGYIKPQVERIARKQYNNEQTPQLFGGKTR